MKTSDPLNVVLEKNDGLLWGRVEGLGNYTPTPFGKDKDEVINSLKSLIKDYVSSEGNQDPYWSHINIEKLKIEFSYDLGAYFHEHDYLKIGAVAALAGLNPGLVRQYASGVKYPSQEQAQKIRTAIEKIIAELKKSVIYAG